MASDQSVRRLQAVLRSEIRGAGLTLQDVSARLGRPPGYTSQIVRGQVKLTVEQLYTILGLIGSEPAEFFGRVHGAAPMDRGAAAADAAAVPGSAREAAELFRGEVRRELARWRRRRGAGGRRGGTAR